LSKILAEAEKVDIIWKIFSMGIRKWDSKLDE